MAIFTETEALINLADIQEIERQVNLTFPHEYKVHLTKHNGGRCQPNVFSFAEKGQITESCIDWFLAIYDGEYDNLNNYMVTYKFDDKRLPNHIIPIAHDPGGNLVCISCGSDDYGKVYFWDHENEVDYTVSGDDDYSNLYLIANSFNEFIDGLTDLELDDE
jgi:cell wall assembly regulator SMI1